MGLQAQALQRLLKDRVNDATIYAPVTEAIPIHLFDFRLERGGGCRGTLEYEGSVVCWMTGIEQ